MEVGEGIRERNRALVLDTVLRGHGTTRTAISQATGLSPATVSRVVDDLLQEGFLDEGRQLHRRGRGRRSTYLEIGSAAGCVVGVDLGVVATRLACRDLRGRTLAERLLDSPRALTGDQMADWLATAVTDLVAEANTDLPLAGLAVAVPARVMNGHQVLRPAEGDAQLAGEELHENLSSLLHVPVHLDSDSNMALVAEMHDGVAAGCRSVVQFTLSTGINAGIAIDGTLLRGKSNSVGEFGSMPFGPDDQPLKSVLTVSGIMAGAVAAGAELADISEVLVLDPARKDLAAIRQRFLDGLVVAVSAVTLSVEPEIVVFNGRMLPLVEQSLPTLHRRLGKVLPYVPRLRLTSAPGLSTVNGAAITALEAARAALLVQARADRQEAG